MSILSPYTEKHFEEIVREHLPFFRGMALRILKNAADADDAVQMALLKGWNRRFFVRSSEKMTGWLGRIVINESYNIYRKRQHENTITTNSIPETAIKSPALADWISSFFKHIALLSGVDTEEASRLLGCPVNTLYQRIHKAKQLLREALKDE